MLCTMEEFSRFYIEVLNKFLTNEMETYNEIHPEEWELIKPDRREKSEAMMAHMRDLLREKGKCGNCSNWEMSASEIKENGFVNNLDVGKWEPTQGLLLQDDIFPHVTGGLRNRRIGYLAIRFSVRLFACTAHSFTCSALLPFLTG